MKDRVVFFILGTIVAILAYFVGDLENTTATNDLQVFDSDVLINGTLTVASGRLQVMDNLDIRKDISELESVVSIATDSEGANILLFNGPHKQELEGFASQLSLYARTMSNGKSFSAIRFKGEYGKDNWMLWSFK